MKEEKNKKTITKEEQKEIKKEHKDKKEEKNKEEFVKLTVQEVEEINRKTKEAEEKALRNQAELINYRKRKDEEVERLLKYSNEDLVLEILPVLDNFERAMSMNNIENEETKKFLNGMNMIYQGLVNALNKFEVKEIDCLDKKFDATYCQAVMTEEVKDKEQDIVLEVYQKGYMLKDKVIRPAMVKVNK